MMPGSMLVPVLRRGTGLIHHIRWVGQRNLEKWACLYSSLSGWIREFNYLKFYHGQFSWSLSLLWISWTNSCYADTVAETRQDGGNLCRRQLSAVYMWWRCSGTYRIDRFLSFYKFGFLFGKSGRGLFYVFYHWNKTSNLKII